MPVLPAEPGLFPDTLFDPSASLDDLPRQWWVLHTRPRQEKSLARQLHLSQAPYYLPVIGRRFRSRGQTLTSHVPLFPGYLFLYAEAKERLAALMTRRVVRTLEVPDQTRLWNDLRQIYQLIASGAPITPEERLAPGTTVEIKSGPLTGLKGKVLRTAAGQRFVVQVDFIQRGASIELDDFALAIVD